MSYLMMDNNKGYMRGEIIEEPIFTHEVMGEKFHEFKIAIARESGAIDEIPVTISERLMIGNSNLTKGSIFAGDGQYRSWNKKEDGLEKSKLLLSFFVRDVEDIIDFNKNSNFIELSGTICKTPVYRTTPKNREICDILVAVNRHYNKSDYIPCIVWGRNARYAKELLIGSKVKIEGRIQSRGYEKKISDDEVLNKTAYEVSITKIMESEQKKNQKTDDFAL